ncbi:MAG: Cys-tRNA(Pro) deacylase [Desulfobulbaceae bacterium]|nr:MAG: Cys-tRNA(Pro) deacylase [Desulfobulbaceae bacterium]
MTPAIALLKKLRINHEILKYNHDPTHQSYGMEAVEKLKLEPQSVFKTLMVALGSGELCVAILPVEKMLDLKKFAQIVGEKKAEMADKQVVQKTTGYVLGGVSPLGQKKRVRTVIDNSAAQIEKIYVSGGRRGLEIGLHPDDLVHLTEAQFSDITLKD